MKRLIYLLPMSILAACTGGKKQEETLSAIAYPQTAKVDTTDTYFGTKIADPYRWLEDDNSPQTAEWVKAENKVTYDYLSKIPYRENIRQRLTKIWNYTKCGTPFKEGEFTFFFKNDGVQNQSVLFVEEGKSEARVLIDPNTLSKEGTTALTSPIPCKGGKLLAYQLAQAGSDWNEIHVMDVKTGKELKDVLKWVKFSGVSWKGDKGFYYSHYDVPTGGHDLSKKNEFMKVYFHTVGESQEKDVLVYEDKEHPTRNFGASLTDDERFLVLQGSESTSGNSLMVKDLSKPNSVYQTIVDNFDNNYGVIDNVGDQLLVITDKNAPKYQLVLIDPAKPQPENWKKIIPESNDLLQSVSLCYGKIIAKFLKDVTSRVYIYNLDGKQENELKLDGLCMVDEINGTKKDSVMFYSFVTFTNPTTIYKYNLKNNQSAIYFKPKIDFNSDEYETKQVFYPSKDGTKIPMFITCKKGLALDGNNPCFLYGYGGFNISNTPRFSTSNIIFLEQGGIYAVANLRGGGEYGEEWHKAGTKCNKQNVFDDFIAAADYLVKEKYTSNAKLAIHGRSNGGLLIGATMTERPDLAKVALPGVGVLDMLRYHKFTIGYAWASDYGTSADKSEFDCLIKYSPVHNVKEVEYPATMVLTGDHDDRVVPAHSFKFAATLQEKHKGSNPALIRIDVNAGHGAGKPTSKLIDEQTDVWSFVFYNLGVQPKL